MPAVAPLDRLEVADPSEFEETPPVIVGESVMPTVEEDGLSVLGAGVGEAEGVKVGCVVGCALVGRGEGDRLGFALGFLVGGSRVGDEVVGKALPTQAGPV